MAEHATTTPLPKLVSYEAAAAMEWEPVALDVPALARVSAALAGPHMANVRLAAHTLAKTKAELIQVVRDLGALQDDGGELTVMVRGMNASEDLFISFARMLQSADARLFAASCAAVLAEDAA